MSATNKPCPICGGVDRFYLIAAPTNGGAPYWRCRQCDYTEAHEEDDGLDNARMDHGSRHEPRTKEQIEESYIGYTAVALHCAEALWTKAGKAALDYLRDRGLSDAMIRGAKLGWCGDGMEVFRDLFYHNKPAYEGAMTGGLRKRQAVPRPVCQHTITIPYMDGDTCVLLRGRKLHPKPGEKYFSPAGPLYAGGEPRFYLHHVLQDAPAIILTEGEIKALVAHQEWRAGRSPLPCIATTGIYYLPPSLIATLQGKVVYLAYDNERPKRGERLSAGERGISRNGKKLSDAGIAVKVIELPRGKYQDKTDLDSFILSERAA